jgi:serine/threonine protein kinase
MQCVKCGTQVPEGSRYCLSCGAQVTDPGAATVAVSSAPVDPLLDQLRAAVAADYEVERELGRGGMAIVYKAREVELRRPVALKVLPPEMAVTPSIAERFKREARLAASLEHPHIVPVYRVGQAAGLQYMAMKFVEGCAIDDTIKANGALPLEAVLLVLRAAASALAAAHERGIVHRDVKGANILVDRDGRVLVSDFGIARAVEEAGLTASGSVMGTPYFMSPEQCAGQRVGPPSDQYSLGVVAFQTLSGAVPFDAETLPGILHHHFFTPVPDLHAIRDEVPAALVAWIGRALAKKEEDRFATTRDMVRALEAIPLSDEARERGEEYLRQVACRGALPKIPTRPFSAASTVAPGSLGDRGDKPRAPQLASTDFVDRKRLTPIQAPPVTTVAGPAGKGETVVVGPGAAPSPQVNRSMTKWPAIVAALVVLVAGAGGALYIMQRGRPAREIQQGIEAYQARRYEAARGAFEKAARDYPTLAAPHVYLSRMAREAGDLVTARREAERALRAQPGDAAALREMGAVMFAAGNYDLARRFFTRAAQAAPDDLATQGYLGCALLRLGRSEEGFRFIQRAGPGPWQSCRAPDSGG